MNGRRLGWFRFSLRAFLLAITLIAIWVAVQVNRANSQRRTVDALADYGYVVYEHEIVSANAMPGGYAASSESKRYVYEREAPGPTWLRSLLGEEYFRRVVQLDVAAHRDVFEQLENLPDIERLSLDGYDLRDEDLATLAMLPRLRTLEIFGAPNITDEGLKHLLRLDLRELQIAHTPISDRAVGTLSKLDGLKRLLIRHTSMTEEGDRALRELMPNTEFRPQALPPAFGYLPPPPPQRESGRFSRNHKLDETRKARRAAVQSGNGGAGYAR